MTSKRDVLSGKYINWTNYFLYVTYINTDWGLQQQGAEIYKIID